MKNTNSFMSKLILSLTIVALGMILGNRASATEPVEVPKISVGQVSISLIVKEIGPTRNNGGGWQPQDLRVISTIMSAIIVDMQNSCSSEVKSAALGVLNANLKYIDQKGVSKGNENYDISAADLAVQNCLVELTKMTGATSP